jgi:hypothetical protein
VSLQVIRAGIDTLEVSFSGRVKDEVAEALDIEKAAAIDVPRPYCLGIVEMMVMDKAFARWSWRLVSPEFSIVMQRGEGPGAKAQVRFSAFGLANRELGELWALAQLALRFLGDFQPLSVSRCDVCVDFHGWTPTASNLAGMVCAAPYRATHGTEKGIETFQYGKGDIVLRIYDKTAELAVSRKTWLFDVWNQSNNFVHDQRVWRIEAQLRRKALKDLHIDSVEQVMSSPGALLDFGLSWANLRLKTTDMTKTRWPEDPRWSELRQAVFGGVPLGRSSRPNQLMTLDRAKTGLLGLVALAGAYFDTTDYLSALQQLSFATEAHVIREKIDFAALVEDKRRRIMAGDY